MLKQKKADHQKLLAEIKAKQDEFKGKEMPQDAADWIDGKATEALALQDEIDKISEREAKMAKLKQYQTASDTPAPEDRQPDQKGEIAGYVDLGEFVAAQPEFKHFLEAGMPKGPVRLAKLARPLFGKKGRDLMVALTREQVAEIKAVPTLGANVIEPQLLSEVVRVTEHDRLTIRDVLNTSRTGSNAVRFTRITDYTRAAAAVAASAQKPEAALTMDAVTEPVRKVAVWTPVEDEQLADLPQLSGIINDELLFDVNHAVEELVMYGSGVGEEFDGLLTGSNVPTFSRDTTGTLIDIVRRMITDVRLANYEATAVLVHPLEWETIVLEKGSDNRYVWVVVTEGNVQRLWGVPVVETKAVEDNAGVSTEERNILVGDFRRGATLWDREDAAISVGWINDQFIRNQRTILAEWRGAFGIKRPNAFTKYQTQAASAS